MSTSPRTETPTEASTEELIKHLECLSGVLNELRRREKGSELPTWLRTGLLQADFHLLSAQVALQELHEGAEPASFLTHRGVATDAAAEKADAAADKAEATTP